MLASGYYHHYKLLQNWIGNERKRRKGLDKEKTKKKKKAPQKLRAPNPYNLFVKDFFKSMGMIISFLLGLHKCTNL